jgi:hypothetical protein
MTSINSITPTAAQSAWQSPFKQISDSFGQLGKSLSAGDLSGAQQAFASLQQNLPQGQNSQGNSANGNGGPSKLKQDFATLGDALQSGNLTAAQQAYATLQQDFQSVRGGHRHHHRGGDGSQSSSQPAAGAPTGDAGTGSGTSVETSISVEISETTINVIS